MSRINFTAKTKRIVAERAGYRCSLPWCGKTTNGPGKTSEQVARVGVAAHIYSAAPNGPRGRGGLSDEEIEQPGNGIWLCENHGRLVDNNQGNEYPSETLLSYKGLHEGRIKREVSGLCPTVGWVHEIEVASSPAFVSGAKARLGKLNLLYGKNLSGKTSIWRYLAGAFDPTHLGYWHPPRSKALDIRVRYLRPQLTDVRLQVAIDGTICQSIDGQKTPLNTLPIRMICLEKIVRGNEGNDRKDLATALDLEDWEIENLVSEVNSFPHAKIRNVQFKDDGDFVRLYADVEGTQAKYLSLLSGRETERVFMEFATAAARASARYCPTLLVLDRGFIWFENWFEYYEEHLLNPENQFQTIMCMPTNSADLDAIRWHGWEVIRTIVENHKIRLTQQPKKA